MLGSSSGSAGVTTAAIAVGGDLGPPANSDQVLSHGTEVHGPEVSGDVKLQVDNTLGGASGTHIHLALAFGGDQDPGITRNYRGVEWHIVDRSW